MFGFLAPLFGPIATMILGMFKNKQDNAAKTEIVKQEGRNLEIQKVVKEEETKKAKVEHYTELGTAGGSELKARLIFYIIAVICFVGILAGIFPDQVNHFVDNIYKVFDAKTIEWVKQLINSFVGNMGA